MTPLEMTTLFQRSKTNAANAPSYASAWLREYRQLVIATDALVISLSLLVAFLVRFHDDLHARIDDSNVSYVVVALGIALLWMLALDSVESRSRKVFGAGPDEYRRVINGSVQTFGVVAIIAYLAHADLSRTLFLTALPVGLVALLTSRWLCRRFLNRARADGRALTQTLVVGEPGHVSESLAEIRRHPEAGYHPSAVSLLGHEGDADGWEDAFSSVSLVDFGDLEEFLAEHKFGAVVVAGGLSRSATRHLSWRLENVPVELFFVPELTDVAGPRIHLRTVECLGLMQVDLPRFSGINHLVKRAFDVVFASVALVLMTPVLAAIAVAIKVDDGGPLIFRQQRVGRNGESFTIHKFRTMTVDAESHLDELRAASTGNGVLFKMDHDPRITRIGGVLRRWSLDELPQFWTVLRGHMSVVGPRPHLAHELAAYPDEGLRRLLIKPGITGLWQVSGRSDLSLTDSIRLDLSYVENWSLGSDLAIIGRTIRAMVSPSGAY
ncbi:MAG TPA: sugar transferase [Propionibacteriaceae bacterium]|nr:sugar transferase [Propionibacteriaceae bacterium]